MKFVDEVIIRVDAGKGGNGCMGFRREKFIPRGGPDGGDGGDGGSIYLVVEEGLNTLVDFRYERRFKAQDGQPGMGKQCNGRKGEDLYVRVPAGTLVHDAGTEELIGDLVRQSDTLLVARGGRHGLGNVHFKSSTNRAPRKTTKGEPGEVRDLRLELRLLADVGVVGLPNAGKSSLIRAVSAARPKVADYPFSTLYPSLGVVRTGAGSSFVIADVPGLIEGASQGAGLGIQFLRHLGRTRLLLHLIDVAARNEGRDPVVDFHTVDTELRNYSGELARRERWLVLNKIDMLPPAERDASVDAIVRGIGWRGPAYTVSALSGEGCEALMLRLQDRLSQMLVERQAANAAESPPVVEAEAGEIGHTDESGANTA
ncbi:MAG: GTPase ObgE [Gammaproteobacteria bacterium]|nr:GTPase ObgE [Gammaproteobacteria bacterium]